ncbi:MAG: flavin reductase family protein [Bacteroidia bacterium]|nr:flavin reductase family protein [Bacteroidia bacterium]
MLSIDPQTTPIPKLHQYLVGAVAPRPIAFVSTISADGIPNLAPYSFFNVFGSNPPVAAFSSNRRVRGNTTKDTLSNVKATGEAVINIVNYAIVHQMALTSVDYAPEVNEFEKAGLTPIPSDRVKPFRVKESPVQMECIVKDIITIGEGGGGANIVICEIVKIHISESILDADGDIDPFRADLMARMGKAWYCRANGANVFPIVQPFEKIGVGFDQLPQSVKQSPVLTGKQLWQLAAVEKVPDRDLDIMDDHDFQSTLSDNSDDRVERLHTLASEFLNEGKVEKAWQVLLAASE